MIVIEAQLTEREVAIYRAFHALLDRGYSIDSALRTLRAAAAWSVVGWRDVDPAFWRWLAD